MASPGESRRAELRASLGAVRARIAAACATAGRDPAAVTLVAVTKTYPAMDVVALAELGVTDFGESRDQEAGAKVAEVERIQDGHAVDRRAVDWHFVGQVQRRKARSVARYAGTVHSVDRAELVTALADARAAAGTGPLDVFVQVSLDGDPGRGGVPADGVTGLADAVATRPELRLRGVMAVAPMDADPDEAFARLAETSAALVARHPGAGAISAGMSGDLEAAIRHGATHVRVGTALLGRRPPVIS